MAIKHIIFDLFGTIVIPKSPIHEQYTSAALSCGLRIPNQHKVKQSFRTAFKQTDAEHPIYGKATGLNPASWWSLVIKRTLLYSGVTESAFESVGKDLTNILVNRFATSEAYNLFSDVLPAFSEIKTRHPQVSLSVVSQTDMAPQILGAFGLLAPELRDRQVDAAKGYIHPKNVITSWDVGYGKASNKIWDKAFQTLNEIRRKNHLESLTKDEILNVGDDQDMDVIAPRKFGFQAVHLRRTSSEPILSPDEISTLTLIPRLIDTW